MFRNWTYRPRYSNYVAYHLFSMISGTQTPLPAVEAFDHLEALCGSVTSLIYAPEVGSHPRRIIGIGDGTVVIAISGAQTLYMFQGLLNGYGHPPDASVATANANPFAKDAVDAICGPILALEHKPAAVLIGGYSYGAVVAYSVFRTLHGVGIPLVRLITYGSPKATWSQYASSMSSAQLSNIEQYANDNDPVPFVYPNKQQAPNAHSLVSPATSKDQDSYSQVERFQLLRPSGLLQRFEEYPDATTGTPEQAILGWISGREGWNTSGHHWTTYRQRLFLAMRNDPDQGDEGNAVIGNTSEGGFTAQQLQTTTAYTPISPPIYAPGQVPVQLPANPVQEARMRSTGLGNLVEWNGIPIARLRTKGDARKLRATLKRLATARRRSEEFISSNLDDASDYQATLEHFGQQTVVR